MASGAPFYSPEFYYRSVGSVGSVIMELLQRLITSTDPLRAIEPGR